MSSPRRYWHPLFLCWLLFVALSTLPIVDAVKRTAVCIDIMKCPALIQSRWPYASLQKTCCIFLNSFTWSGADCWRMLQNARLRRFCLGCNMGTRCGRLRERPSAAGQRPLCLFQHKILSGSWELAVESIGGSHRGGVHGLECHCFPPVHSVGNSSIHVCQVRRHVAAVEDNPTNQPLTKWQSFASSRSMLLPIP